MKVVDRLIFMAQGRYKKDFDKNFWTFLTFKVGQLVFLNDLPCFLVASVANKIKAASYNKLLLQVCGPQKIVVVHHNTMEII